MKEVELRPGNSVTDTRMSYFDIKVWDELVEFSKEHNELYIFGNGKTGESLGYYFTQAGINFDGYIESGDLSSFSLKYLKGQTGIILGLSDKYYDEVLPNILLFVDKSDLFYIPESEKANIAVQFSLEYIRENFWITIYTTYHCNLNCKSCLTHSPICPPEFYDYDKYIQDIDRLKVLKLNVTRLNFSGGEPFLHPRILDMFRLARNNFKGIPSTVYTNGSLLYKLSDAELQELVELDIELAITEYPVPSANYRKHLSTFYERIANIPLKVQRIVDEENKLFYKHPYNVDGDTPKHEFINCHRYRHCFMVRLYNHKFWKCYNAPNAEQFNTLFNTNMQTSADDCLDITGDITAENAYEFCRKRIPFCGYCKPLKDTFEWALSERKKEEWL